MHSSAKLKAAQFSIVIHNPRSIGVEVDLHVLAFNPSDLVGSYRFGRYNGFRASVYKSIHRLTSCEPGMSQW